MNPIEYDLISQTVALYCKVCDRVWTQTKSEAIRDPLSLARCPRCRIPWQPVQEDTDDAPIIVEEGRR